MGTPVTARNVDLSNCDREQIQFAAAILPHGVLLVVQEPELKIVQASQNTDVAFGIAAEALLGAELTKVLSAEQVHSLREKLQSEPLAGPPTRVAIAQINGREWNVLGHRHDRVLFLEFEPRGAERPSSVADLYSELREASGKLQNAKNLQEFLDLTVRQVQAFTGFDRVMAYQFQADGTGWVRAEAVVEGQTPYLGLHYPASDVPAPARRLFSLAWVRHQPDIGYVPVPMVPENNPVTGGPLDMSYAILRSVSVMYTGYLKNMGTHSSMVLTLSRNGAVIGLIACHHHSGPKHVSYEVRLACEFLAHMVSLLFSAKEELEHSEYRAKLKTTQSALLHAMAKSAGYVQTLAEERTTALDFVKAGGAAVSFDGKIETVGKALSVEQVEGLLDWLVENVKDEIFSTDKLSAVFPPAAQYTNVASGLLAMRLEATMKGYVLWFRPEVLQTVNWAGDPRKPVDISADGERLMPRTSFALWKETVRERSEPWLGVEVEAARELRAGILELILRKAEETRRLYLDLQQSHIELDAFAYVASHDLKEPLRGIHNYSRFLLEDCADQLRSEDMEKLQAMSRLTQRMEDLLDSLLKYSRVGRAELSRERCDLNEIVEHGLDTLSFRIAETGAGIRIPQPLPTVVGDPVLLGEVFTNLISNALKYNDKQEKWVEIGFRQDPGTPLVLHVRDNGIGIEGDHLQAIFMIFRRLHGPKEFGGGTGAGLTIARKIVERMGGRMWVESKPGQGSTFYFTVRDSREGTRS